MEEEDDFKVVRRKKGSRMRYLMTASQKDKLASDSSAPSTDKAYVRKRLIKDREDLYGSEYFKQIKEKLGESTNGEQNPESLVCYGLGSFGSCLIAQYQLALLLLLREEFSILDENCLVFDPILNQPEKEVLQELGCTVIDKNEEGKRVINKKTLFYMPHCGKALYNNLLWANWGPTSLEKLVVIGNSFNHMHTSVPERVLQKQAGYVLSILPYTKEVQLVNNFQFTDIYNNTSIHIFPAELLSKAHAELWTHNQEPQYDEEDVEIIVQEGS